MCSKRKALVKELQPEILLFHILPRLSGKAICRFKCVSKQWNSFLKTPMFADMHLHHQNHHKLLFISTETPCKFGTIDCEAPNNDITPTRSFPFNVACPENLVILTSCNGLVCLGLYEYKKYRYLRWNDNYNQYLDLILWNPLTGDYKTLSKTNSQKECYQITSNTFVLYYTSFEDDYKLLCVTKSRYVYIYSLKSDSWRKVESTEDLHCVSDYMMPCASPIDEKLYFLKRDKTINRQTYAIMRFDLKTGMFIEKTTPFLRYHVTASYCFMVLGGRIHVWKSYLDDDLCYYKIELWRMDGVGDGDGYGDWIKMVTYCSKFDDYSVTWILEPLHLMMNGKWLMHCDGGYLCKVNPEKPTNDYIYTEDMKILLRGKYVETLVSPNQYI